MVKDSNDAICLLDFDGNIVAWNRGAERIYGYTEAEALRLNLRELVPPRHKEGIGDWLAMLRRETVDSYVTERRKKDGSSVRVWLTVTRLLDEKVEPELIATTERDLGLLDRQALQQLTGERMKNEK